jgi:branched-chain amino acid transport system permease protein
LMGFGAAVTSTLFASHGWDLFLALLAGAAVAGGLAVLIGIPALRISGPYYLAVVTLALAVAAANYFLVPQYFSWLDPTKALLPPPLFGRIDIGSDRQMYYVCLVALVVIMVAVRGVRSAHAGRAILATKENRLATESIGLSTTRLNVVAFALSGSIAGLAGGFFAVQQHGFNFGSFDAESGLTFLTMVVIGGLGSLPGSVLGAVYVYGSIYLLQPGFQLLSTGLGLLVLLMFFPGGLGELMYRGRDYLLRAVANRRGIVVPSLVADSAAGRQPEDAVALFRQGLGATVELPAPVNGRSGSRPNGRARTGARSGERP